MKTPTPAEAKAELKRKGWSYRSAAPLVGRSFRWICWVCNGRATSAPVLRAIMDLPVREPAPRKPAK